jgi:hypothetical protein
LFSLIREFRQQFLQRNLKVSLYQNQAEIPVGGRLRFFLENWNKITDDQWVLSIIQEGYKLEFIEKPPQSKIRKTLVSLKDTKILLQEVNILLEPLELSKEPIDRLLFCSNFPEKISDDPQLVSLPDSDISLPSDSSQLLFFMGIRKEEPQPDPD